MNIKHLQDIEDFHTKFGLAYNDEARVHLPPAEHKFSVVFLREEVAEYNEAMIVLKQFPPNDKRCRPALAQLLDALVDLSYVAIGRIYRHGFGPMLVERVDNKSAMDAIYTWIQQLLIDREVSFVKFVQDHIQMYEHSQTEAVKFETLFIITIAARVQARQHMFHNIFDEAWDRVHKANMDKVPAENEKLSTRGFAMDIVKPVGWLAPDLEPLIDTAAEQEADAAAAELSAGDVGIGIITAPSDPVLEAAVEEDEKQVESYEKLEGEDGAYGNEDNTNAGSGE